MRFSILRFGFESVGRVWEYHMLRCLRLSLATLAVCLAVSLTSFAQAAAPSANTFIILNSSSNYGGSNGLAVSPTNLTFIQFDFSWLPQSASVNKATLRLFLDNITANGSFDVYQVNGPWTQTTLNYYNMPAIGVSATGGNPRALVNSQIRSFVLIDITPLAQAWVNGSTPNYGVALRLTTSAGNFQFDSKENTTASHEPELEIELNGPVGPQGPQGPQGTIATKYTVTVCQIDYDGTGSNGVLQASDARYSECINALTATITITSVQCIADVPGATKIQISTNVGATVLAAPCTIGNSLTTCNLNGTPTITNGQWLNGTLTPDNTQKYSHCVVAGTY